MNTAAYQRKRRLAFVISGASVVLLALWLLLGGIPGVYRHPRLVRTGPEIVVLHDARRDEPEEVIQVLLSCDPATLRPRTRMVLYGGATAAADGPAGLVLFYGRRWSPFDPSGQAVNRELAQAWPVTAASG